MLFAATVPLRRSGSLDPDQVWQRYVSLDAWSTWAPQIAGVECETRVLAPGIAGRVRSALGSTVPFEVTEVDSRDRRWVWRVSVEAPRR